MSFSLNTGGVSAGPRPFLNSPHHLRPQFSARISHIAAANKSTPRTGKFDSKNRRATSPADLGRRLTIEKEDGGGAEVKETYADDGFVVEDLEGMKPDFWEGSKWDGLGFFVQYMWAFGIVFAVVAVGIAVATYNEGATDFKETPVYQEAIQSQELIEEPDASNSDVFESNPTEQAPTLE